MSDFGDQLLTTITELEAEARAAAKAADDEWRAAAKAFATTRAMAGALLMNCFRPLLKEFQAVIEDREVLRDGKIRVRYPAVGRERDDVLGVVYQGLGRARVRHCYEIALNALILRDGTFTLTAQCSHYHPNARLRPTDKPQPLLSIPGPTNVDKAIDEPAARQWCQDALKQSAAAIMEAVFASGPVPPAPRSLPAAPFVGRFVAPPAVSTMPIDMPVTV